MAVIPVWNLQVFAVGNYSFGPAVVPDGISMVQLDLATVATGVGATLNITFERSDDGVTWIVVHRMEMSGGITPRGPNAGLPANLHASMTLDVVAGQQFRATLAISGAPITLSATATTS